MHCDPATSEVLRDKDAFGYNLNYDGIINSVCQTKPLCARLLLWKRTYHQAPLSALRYLRQANNRLLKKWSLLPSLCVVRAVEN